MNDIIRIERRDGKETVNARELHLFLESKQDYSDWVKGRIEKYGFIDGQDFTIILGKSTGGRPTRDYFISLDMAKELSMVENNDRGRQARLYFIEVEKRARSVFGGAVPKSLPEALRLAADLAEQNEQLTPKAEYCDRVLNTEDLVQTTQIAADLGMSAIRLNRLLEQSGIQYKSGDQWILTAKYKDKGYTQSRTSVYVDKNGEEHSKMHTYWTQKGRKFIHDLVESGCEFAIAR